MLNETNIFKHDVLHLMIWLSAQPPQQSTAYIHEALCFCMREMNLDENEISSFVEKVKIENVVLGNQLPDDEKTKIIYKTFMGYLLRIKNQ